MSEANRVETMAHKLAVYAARAGVQDAELITDAYYIAVRPRLAVLPGVFHPDLLHPARTALILIEHARCRAGAVLAAAELTETLDARLRARPADIQALGSEVAGLVAAVPLPEDEETLLERLLTAERDVALIALAERLDHARHLHMRAPEQWRSYFQQTLAVYLPLAQRTEEEIFLRFQRWAHAFQRRLA
ncbi:MAG TPA: HD domain-containing protein [Longimicrobiales bacterium]